jgi:hypothetical protein
MKYIFMAGAPGSKWSSVAHNIYYSADIDRSDYHDSRTYYHDASGKMQLMHSGAYFDPGMEFGKFFDQIHHYSKQECETEFDRAFAPDCTGIRIIKSHVFANHIDFLKRTWPSTPVVLVYRSTDACLGWWVRCGGFDITYPDYREYYKDLPTMGRLIEQQNKGIDTAWHRYSGTEPKNNVELAQALGLDCPPPDHVQNYHSNDIKVKVI